MCAYHSLQEKAYKIAICHCFLSIIALLILILFVLNQVNDPSPYQVNCKSDIVNSTQLGGRKTSCLINKFHNIIAGRINIFKNVSSKTLHGSVLIVLVLLLDLSLNVLLLKGVKKRRSILFLPWLFAQGIRMLVCVTSICVTVSLYIFDISPSVRIAENDTKEIGTTSTNDTYALQNKTRFLPR